MGGSWVKAKCDRVDARRVIARLMHRELPVWQVVLAGMCSALGLGLALLFLEVYGDVRDRIAEEQAGAPLSFVTLNRKVSVLNTLQMADSGFDEGMMDEIKVRPGVVRVGAYLSNAFRVTADIGGGAMPQYRVELFLEAVPDEFLDVESDRWFWEADGRDVPVLVPVEFLNLYNLVFAPSRGLPQVSGSMVRAVRFSMMMGDAPGEIQRRGVIAGFSHRFQTLLVPESYLLWANARLAGSERPRKPNRLIVEVKDPDDREWLEWLRANGYESSRGAASGHRVRRIVDLAGIVLVGSALLVMAFAIVLHSVSAQLWLTRSRDTIRQLSLLGFGPSDIRRPALRGIVVINLVVLLGAWLFPLIWNVGIRSRIMVDTSGVPVMMLSGQVFWSGLILAGLAAMVQWRVHVAGIRQMLREEARS